MFPSTHLVKAIATTVVCAILVAALAFWTDYLPASILEGLSSAITEMLITTYVATILTGFGTK
jgi:hypothetical protein